MPEWITRINDALTDLNLISTTFRILLAMLCGGVIGLEREKANQAAGMRTYMLVCMGASVVMLTGQYMYETYQTGDPARLGAQVITGIGFLGAGSIIISGGKRVKGLTTAAGLWVSGCIGLAIGIGFYSAGILMTAAVFLVMSKLRQVEEHIVYEDLSLYIYLELNLDTGLSDLSGLLEARGLEIKEIRMNKIGKHCQKVIVSILNHPQYAPERITELLNGTPGIRLVKILS